MLSSVIQTEDSSLIESSRGRAVVQSMGLKEKKVKVKSLCHVWLFATPWTVAHQAPLSMGFFRQEYWSGLSFPSLKEKKRRAKETLRKQPEGTGCLSQGYWGRPGWLRMEYAPREVCNRGEKTFSRGTSKSLRVTIRVKAGLETTGAESRASSQPVTGILGEGKLGQWQGRWRRGRDTGGLAEIEAARTSNQRHVGCKQRGE